MSNSQCLPVPTTFEAENVRFRLAPRSVLQTNNNTGIENSNADQDIKTVGQGFCDYLILRFQKR